MLGLFNPYKDARPIAPEQRGPGEVVQEKYNRAVGSVVDFTKNRTLGFLATGIGKGILAAAVITIGLAAISMGLAAAAGTVPIIGAFGIATTATASQGVMIGIAQGISFLMSGAGLGVLGLGGLVGAVAESKRVPPMSVEDAKDLAQKYKESRERTNEPQVTQEVSKETAPATAPEKISEKLGETAHSETRQEAPAKETRPALVKDEAPQPQRNEHAAHNDKTPVHDIEHSAAHDSKFHLVKNDAHKAPSHDTAHDMDKDHDKTTGHVAREMQRRSESAAAQVQVG